jgi:hypothetical protein
MRVLVTVDRVVLDGLRASPAQRARLLARLEGELAGHFAALPADAWTSPADTLAAPIRAAVTGSLTGLAGAAERTPAARPAGGGRP